MNYARLIRLITIQCDRHDDAGRFARRLHRKIDCLWLFLVAARVSPTNHHAESMLRLPSWGASARMGYPGERVAAG